MSQMETERLASISSKEAWDGTKISPVTPFSPSVAYTWVCSVIASVLSVSSTKPKSSHADQLKRPLESSTPSPKNRQVLPVHLKRKTLILDLDETLVHSTIKPVTKHDMTVDVLIDGVNCTFYVIKRPHVDHFLKKVAEWFDVIIFTASMQQYADPLINQLDTKRVVKSRLFRESCLQKDGNFVKDLSLIGQDLASTVIVDNSPVAYSNNKDSALPIDNWMGDNPSDESLLNLLPFLNALRFTSDVRSILSLRT